MLKKRFRIAESFYLKSLNRTEFINLILDKRSLNKEVYDLSLKIDDFPIARQVLNKILGNINLDLILKSNKIIEINNAKGDLIANTVNFINDSRLKSETKRFIEDLVDQKIFGSNFENIEITNRENKNNNKTKQINNTSKNKLIPDLGNSTNRENIVEQIPNNKNPQRDKSPIKKEMKSRDFANKSIKRGQSQEPEKERKGSEEIRKRVLRKSKYLIPLFSIALLALIPIQIYKTNNNILSKRNSNSRYQETINYKSGNKYVGELKDGKKHGQGTYTWADGEKYVGEYKDGKRHGQGTYTWANGDKYVGEFRDGKRTGQGTYTWANGNSWTGQWINNNKNLSTGQWASGYRNDSVAKYSLKEQLIREKEEETMSIKNYKNKCYSMYKNAKYIDVSNIMTLNYFVNKDNTITTVKWHLNKLAGREPYCEIGKNLNGILNQTITSSCPTKSFFSKKNTSVTIQRQTFLTEESRNMAPNIGLGLRNKIPPGKTKNFLVIYKRERPCSKESNWSPVSDRVIGLAVDIPRNIYYDYYGYKYNPTLK